jgi:superfamily II DNA/RNA helicase
MILRNYFRPQTSLWSSLASLKANRLRFFSAEGLDKFAFSEKTKDILKKRGFTDLLPIQREMFKPIFERKNVIGQDMTGTGKTLAYIMPILEYFRKEKLIPKKKFADPYILTITPTRELVVQVYLPLTLRLFKNSMGCYTIVMNIMSNQCSEDCHHKELIIG